jgi:hypothetical protein
MELMRFRTLATGLTRISHTFSGQIAALPIEIASQVGEDSVHATRPRPLERQDHRAGCASCQRKCEKCGLNLVGTVTLTPDSLEKMHREAMGLAPDHGSFFNNNFMNLYPIF